MLEETIFEIAAYSAPERGGDAVPAEVQPDLISMDIIMPGMDGLEAARAIFTGAPRGLYSDGFLPCL